jgi:hypothetical protein
VVSSVIFLYQSRKRLHFPRSILYYFNLSTLQPEIDIRLAPFQACLGIVSLAFFLFRFIERFSSYFLALATFLLIQNLALDQGNKEI